MEPQSHLNLMAMALLQTCSYVTEQMQSDVSIDVNKFLQSFSIQVEGSRIRPPSFNQNDNSITPDIGSSSSLPFFDMEHYRALRKEEAIRWINLQESRSSIIARLRPTTEEEYNRLRIAVTSENTPLHRSHKKQGKNPTYITLITFF